MKTINEKFTEEEYEKIIHFKEELRKKLGKEKLNWHDLILLRCTEQKNSQSKNDFSNLNTDFDVDRETRLF